MLDAKVSGSLRTPSDIPSRLVSQATAPTIAVNLSLRVFHIEDLIYDDVICCYSYGNTNNY